MTDSSGGRGGSGATVALEHWTYQHPCNRALVSERYSLVADDGRHLVTRSTEIEARRSAREQGWRVSGAVEMGERGVAG